MAAIRFREVAEDNWRATLQLAVYPEQQRFIADYTPIAAIILAKAFIRPNGLVWAPYAIYADATLVGLVALASLPASPDRCWLHHFFIDRRYQGQGYGAAALASLVQLVQHLHPACREIRLTVHPENRRAQVLYMRAGFGPTGDEQGGEPVYLLPVRDATAVGRGSR